jgi:hypothetical protein
MTQEEIAQIVAAVIAAQAQAGKAQPKARKAKVASTASPVVWEGDLTATRKGYKFEFTRLGVVRAQSNPTEKYSVIATRLHDGAQAQASVKMQFVGQTIRERYASVSALDALYGFKLSRKFAAVA